MKDFESYAARARLESIRANAARKLTRQQKARRRKLHRVAVGILAAALLLICSRQILSAAGSHAGAHANTFEIADRPQTEEAAAV